MRELMRPCLPVSGFGYLFAGQVETSRACGDDCHLYLTNADGPELMFRALFHLEFF